MHILHQRMALHVMIVSLWFCPTIFGLEIKGKTQADFNQGRLKNLVFKDGEAGKITLDVAYSGFRSENLNYASLPGPLSDFATVVVRDRLYVIGGYTNSGTTRKEVSSIVLGQMGPVGTWRTEKSLPIALAECGGFSNGNKLYVTSSDGSGVIYSAPISISDGTIGTWEKAGMLPSALLGYKVSLLGMRIVLISSDRSGAVYSAPFLANGNIGDWRSEESFPLKISGFAVAETETTLYVIGGTDESSTVLPNVYSISINLDGTLNDWKSQPSLPLAMAFHGAKLDRGLLVVVGGSSGTGLSKTIMSVGIQGDGNLMEWSLAANSVVNPISRHSLVFGDGYLLSCGGNLGGTRSDQISVLPLEFRSSLVEDTEIVKPLEALSALSNSKGIIVNNRFFRLGVAVYDDSIYSIDFVSTGELGPAWRTDQTHPTNGRFFRNRGKLFFASGKMYYIESFNSPPNIYMGSVTSDGALVDWQFAGVCPIIMEDFSVVAVGARLYFIGGLDLRATTYIPLDTVYSAPIQPSGHLGAWTTEPSLPKPTYMAAVLVKGNQIYVSGGRHKLYESGVEVYSSTVLRGGSLGPWKHISNLPLNRDNHEMVLSDNKVLVMGGQNTYKNSYGSTIFLPNTNIDVASISKDGLISAWSVYSTNSEFEQGFPITYRGSTFLLGKKNVFPISYPVHTTDGTFLSPVYDMGGVRNLSMVSWNKITNPSGTSLKCSMALQSDLSGSMDSFIPVTNFRPFTQLARYVQFRAELHTDDILQTAGLDDYTITHYSDSTHPDGAPILSNVNVTTSSLTVSLQDRSVGEDAFQFFLSRTSPPTGDPIKYASVIGSSGTTKTYTFDELLHGTTYYLRARGWNAADSIDGADSNLISIQTPSLDLKRRLSTELLGLDSVVIGWPQVDNAIEYRVFDEKNTLLATKSSTTFSFTESVLTPNTQLFRRIEASDSIGVIQVGSVVIFTGMAAPLATDFSIEGQGNNWISISVNPPVNAEAGLSGTKIILRSEGMIVRTARLKNMESAYRFESLPVGKNYQITVSYLNGDGIESLESPELETFVGLASEIFTPAKEKFRINDGIDFPMDSNEPVHGNLEIYDSQQRKLREIPIDSPAGHSVIHWDGRDDSGNAVYSGVYWAVSETDHFGRKTFKVAGIR